MELCSEYRIPHSHFRGLGDGTWSDLDRRKALAYAAYTKTLCPTCATRAEEWDEDAGGDEDAYTAITHRCVGCQVLADKQKTVPEGDEGHGVKVLLLPTSIHAAMQYAHHQH
jgi:hypothetical protein